MVLLGQIPVHDLKLVSFSLWNVPICLDCPRFYLVEIAGSIKDFHVISVFFFCPENLLINNFNPIFFSRF